MAEADYRRLSCVDCAGAFATPRDAGAGRPRIRCYECSPRSASALVPREERSCRQCGGSFSCTAGSLALYCGSKCGNDASNLKAKTADRRRCETCGDEFGAPKQNKERRWCSEACKPKALRGLFSCRRCGVEFKAKLGDGRTYCSRECAFAQFADEKRPEFCAYYAAHCASCGPRFWRAFGAQGLRTVRPQSAIGSSARGWPRSRRGVASRGWPGHYVPGVRGAFLLAVRGTRWPSSAIRAARTTRRLSSASPRRGVERASAGLMPSRLIR